MVRVRLLLANILIILSIGLCLIACKNDKKVEILVAQNYYCDFLRDSLSDQLTLWKDSNFVFTKAYKSIDNETIDRKKGTFYIKNDTIYFSRDLFKDSDSKTGVIKNGFLEIIGKDACYKIKVQSTSLVNKTTFDNDNFKNYAVFSYCNLRDTDIFVAGKPHDLNDREITQIDSLIRICIKQNSRLENINNEDYIKQCIAIEDNKNEVIVWAYCICKHAAYNFEKDYQRQIFGKVNDGGNCFFRLKFNLTKRTYFELSINGDA